MEANGTRLDEQRFPGRQGRIVFAYLVAQKGRPVPRDELAQLLWGDEPPATWEKALRVLMTKLRSLLDESGVEGSTALTSAYGCYQLTLPDGAWIDVDAAASAVERAEADLTSGRFDDACAEAATATELARRSFLPGEDGPWVEEQRRDLRDLLVRALECLRDASLAAGKFGDALRYANEITDLEPFRESSYRALMQAHAAAGNPAEALRVYERCRQFLANELGAYPSAESEAVYLEILRSSSETTAPEVDRGEDAPVEGELIPPNDAPSRRRRRRVAALVTAMVLVAVAAVAAGLAFASRAKHPLVIRPNSLVRLDPETGTPEQVVPIGPNADQVAVAGNFVWVTNDSLHHERAFGPNTGGRTLTRVDPETDESQDVGNGLAPCGIAPDPSGDLWVANCYGSGSDEVVRVDARTLHFDDKREVPDPSPRGYYRGITYGGDSVWVADPSGDPKPTPWGLGLSQLDRQNPSAPRGSIRLKRHATALAWDEGNQDLWMSNFFDGSVTRMHAATGALGRYDHVANQPGSIAVRNDVVWVADWDIPRVVRIPADGSGPPLSIPLPHVRHPAGVTSLAAGADGIWAADPEDQAIVRIDPKTNKPTRFGFRYPPWGVTVADDGVWVVFRSR